VTIHFCTLFDIRYASRGLTMLESLEARFSGEKTVTILTMDDAASAMVRKMGRPSWNVISVEDLSDTELLDAGRTRPHREFCWTCAPAMTARLIELHDAGDVVVYLDADLYFFASPQPLLDELANGGTILIHEHRYSEDRKYTERASGRFNVGFVAFVVGDEARACTQRWRGQVLDKCVLEPDNGYCGDQGYLNEWPDRYPGLRILQNIGGGVAPWNLLNYSVSGDAVRPCIDNIPVIFFHYHSFRTVYLDFIGYVAAIPAWGYSFSKRAHELLFGNYSKQIRQISRKAAAHGFPVEGDMKLFSRNVLRAWLGGNLISSI
jgi:hypothetical protein